MSFPPEIDWAQYDHTYIVVVSCGLVNKGTVSKEIESKVFLYSEILVVLLIIFILILSFMKFFFLFASITVLISFPVNFQFFSL